MVRSVLLVLSVLVACGTPSDPVQRSADARSDAQTIATEIEVAKDYADNGNFTEAVAAWQRAQGVLDGRFSRALESESHSRDALKLSFLLGRLRHEIDSDGEFSKASDQLATMLRSVTSEVWGTPEGQRAADPVEVAAVP